MVGHANVLGFSKKAHECFAKVMILIMRSVVFCCEGIEKFRCL